MAGMMPASGAGDQDRDRERREGLSMPDAGTPREPGRGQEPGTTRETGMSSSPGMPREPQTSQGAGMPGGSGMSPGVSPGSGMSRGAEMSGEPGTAQGMATGRGSEVPAGASHAPLLPRDESDRLTLRLQHAVEEFIDRPREAVEEADHVLEELAARFTDAVTSRRRTLRHALLANESGQDRGGATGDTEQLRLALKDYRELTERLLHV